MYFVEPMKSKLETEPNVILDKLRVTRIHIDQYLSTLIIVLIQGYYQIRCMNFILFLSLKFETLYQKGCVRSSIAGFLQPYIIYVCYKYNIEQ